MLLVGVKADGFADALTRGPLSPVVALVAFVSIWIVAGLAGFHVQLVASETTTNEDVSLPLPPPRILWSCLPSKISLLCASWVLRCDDSCVCFN